MNWTKKAIIYSGFLDNFFNSFNIFCMQFLSQRLFILKVRNILILSLVIISIFTLNSCNDRKNNNVEPKINQIPKKETRLLSKPKYSLETIILFLHDLFQEQRNGIVRWNKKRINYSIGYDLLYQNKNKTNNKEMLKFINGLIPVFKHHFVGMGNIAGIKVKLSPYLNSFKGNINIIVSTNPAKTLIRKTFADKIFSGYSRKYAYQTLLNAQINNQKPYLSFKLIADSKSVYIKEQIIALLANRFFAENYETIIMKNVFDSFVIRSNNSFSDRIKPSLVNSDFYKYEHRQLNRIDYALLSALYSEKIYYGMPIRKAVPIMARYMYEELKHVIKIQDLRQTR